MYASLLDALESGTTVVTANNRLARTLQHACDQRRIRRGSQAWSAPDLLSWNAWLTRLWQEARLRGGAAAEYELLGDSAAGLLWQQVIAAGEKPDVARQAGRLVRPAREAWLLLNDWQALGAEEWARPGLSPDQKAWLRWSGSYRDHCRQHAWVDSERLCGLLQQDIDAGIFNDHPPLALCGFDTWPPARRALIDALAGRGVRVEETAGELPPAAVRLMVCDDAAAELRAAADWARQRLEDRPDVSIGVVVPDLATRAAEARRVFLDALAPDWRIRDAAADAPLNVSYGEPLAEVPVIAAALNALRIAAGRTTFDRFSCLLRSRWFAGGETEATQRAQLELRLRERLRIEFSLATVAPYCQSAVPGFAVMLQKLTEHSRSRGRQSIPAWAGSFNELLEAVGWPGSDSLDSRTWQALQAWHELLRELAGSGVVLGDVSRAEALAALGQLAQQRLFQPEGRPAGVQVMGTLEAAGHAFEHLWVCGMARELWPVPVRPNPFIPLELQRRLEMPEATPAGAIARAQQLADRLRRSARELTVSMPQQADGERLTPSPFFPAAETAAAVVHRPTWNRAMQAAGATEILGDDPPPSWATGRKVYGGVSVLNLQAVSPLNAFIEKRLGAKEIVLPVAGINSMQRGNLTHHALEVLYSTVPGQAELAGMPFAERDSLLREALATKLTGLPGMSETFMQRLAELETEQQLQRLHAFIAMDLQRSGYRVLQCETGHAVTIGSLTLNLKLDRLDELADGTRLVIDYKTGFVRRQAWNPDRPRDLQLPLYVTCVVSDAAGIAFAQVSSRGIGYDGVGDPGIDIPGMRSPGTRPRSEVKFHYPRSTDVIQSWEALREVWAEQLRELAEQFAAGDFRLDPLNPESARGQFAVLSRVYDDGPRITEEMT